MPNDGLVTDNLRLKELVLVVRGNEPFFREFERFLVTQGFSGIAAFVSSNQDDAVRAAFFNYFTVPFAHPLLDGIGRPYSDKKAKWYFMAWLFRDAPAQRLGPLLRTIPGSTPMERQIVLLNSLRKFVAPLLSDPACWSWAAVSEVILARLEGSRRSLKGTLFEALVRESLQTLIREEGIPLTIGDKQIRLHDETYDVEIVGPRNKILLPVKTRETMGGGHANLFTRDIHKSISVAQANGFICIPIVIAESWGGDLAALECDNVVHIPHNPNQIDRVSPLLAGELRRLLPVFAALALGGQEKSSG